MAMAEKLTPEEVRHVAKLSRLRLSEDEVQNFTEQLSKVLGYMSKLGELNVEGVEPMAHALDMTNVLREDRERPGMTPDAVLANAPDAEPPFFKVPKVIEDEGGA
jgi:aspartyl-tRNA(Asn)/glutamyl-tRNA(Gln) amidotransferase subunit C